MDFAQPRDEDDHQMEVEEESGSDLSEDRDDISYHVQDESVNAIPSQIESPPQSPQQDVDDEDISDCPDSAEAIAEQTALAISQEAMHLEATSRVLRVQLDELAERTLKDKISHEVKFGAVQNKIQQMNVAKSAQETYFQELQQENAELQRYEMLQQAKAAQIAQEVDNLKNIVGAVKRHMAEISDDRVSSSEKLRQFEEVTEQVIAVQEETSTLRSAIKAGRVERKELMQKLVCNVQKHSDVEEREQVELEAEQKLENEILKVEKEVDALKQQGASYNAMLEQNTYRNQALTLQLRDSSSANIILVEQRDNLLLQNDQNIKELNDINQIKEASLRELEAKEGELLNRRESIQENIKDVLKTSNELKQRICQNYNRLASYKEQLMGIQKGFQEDANEHWDKMKQLKEARFSITDKLDVIKEELRTLNKEEETLSEKSARLLNTIASNTCKYSSMQSEYANLLPDMEETRVEIDKLHGSIKEVQLQLFQEADSQDTKLREFENPASDINRRLHKARAEHKIAKEKKEKEAHTMREKIEECKKQHSRNMQLNSIVLEDKMIQLHREKITICTQIETLRKSNMDKIAKMNDYKKATVELYEKYKNLQDESKRLERGELTESSSITRLYSQKSKAKPMESHAKVNQQKELPISASSSCKNFSYRSDDSFMQEYDRIERLCDAEDAAAAARAAEAANANKQRFEAPERE